MWGRGVTEAIAKAFGKAIESGYRRLEKRLGQTGWRLQNGWCAVGGAQQRLLLQAQARGQATDTERGRGWNVHGHRQQESRSFAVAVAIAAAGRAGVQGGMRGKAPGRGAGRCRCDLDCVGAPPNWRHRRTIFPH